MQWHQAEHWQAGYAALSEVLCLALHWTVTTVCARSLLVLSDATKRWATWDSKARQTYHSWFFYLIFLRINSVTSLHSAAGLCTVTRRPVCSSISCRLAKAANMLCGAMPDKLSYLLQSNEQSGQESAHPLQWPTNYVTSFRQMSNKVKTVCSQCKRAHLSADVWGIVGVA